MKKIKVNRDNTVGVLKLSKAEHKRIKKIRGFFNKKLLKRALKHLDEFPDKDVKISFAPPASGNDCMYLLIQPDPDKNVYIGCAGKTRKES